MIKAREDAKPVEEYFEVPKTYTLESQLVMIIIQNYVFNTYTSKEIKEMEENTFAQGLANLLVEKLKLPFTEIKVEKTEEKIMGKIVYNHGKPIEFTVQIHEVNEN